MPRLTIVLEHGANRPFEPFDRQSQLRHNNGKSLPELLYEFRDLRHDSIAGVRETRILAGQFRNPIGTWGDHQPFPLFRAFGSDVRGGCIYVPRFRQPEPWPLSLGSARPTSSIQT
jgi:hypothetical protein